jgi:hypothetical protein
MYAAQFFNQDQSESLLYACSIFISSVEFMRHVKWRCRRQTKLTTIDIPGQNISELTVDFCRQP